MNAFLSTAILLAGLTQASSSTATGSGHSQASSSGTGWAITQSASNAPVVTSTIAVSGDNLIGLPLSIAPDYTGANVLVVPTSDLPPASVADLTQDLTVMCRLFAKSVPFTTTGKAPIRPARNNDVFYGLVLGPMTRGAQALYLDGYGALFFLHVDYPLVPTEPQEPAQPKTAESTDTVWTRTVQELTGQPGDEQQTARNTPTYDARRVEELRQALIKTLVHCANIRLRPLDLVTLVVGDLDDNRRPNFKLWPALRSGLATTGSSAAAPASPAQPATRPPTAALLILRVAKADVDAFAKTQLTLDQFTQKVQVLFSPSASSAPASSTSPSSRR